MLFKLRSSFSKISFSLIVLILSYRTVTGQQVSIPVESRNSAILLQTDKDNRLRMVYSGGVLSDKNEYNTVADQYNLKDENAAGVYNNAYSTAGTYSLTEPAMQVTTKISAIMPSR